MTIVLENIGKRFNREWIFRSVDYVFESGQSYALLGHNGSGKSTLLSILSGWLTPTSGRISWKLDQQDIPQERIFAYLGLSAPYLEVIEDLTLEEHLHFHARFKPFSDEVSLRTIIDLLGLEKHRHKFIKNFSSGMKQRLKLALAIIPSVPLILLDEPTTNLDREGVDWYLNLMERFSAGKTVIIASNTSREYSFCAHRLTIEDYKR